MCHSYLYLLQQQSPQCTAVWGPQAYKRSERERERDFFLLFFVRHNHRPWDTSLDTNILDEMIEGGGRRCENEWDEKLVRRGEFPLPAQPLYVPQPQACICIAPMQEHDTPASDF